MDDHDAADHFQRLCHRYDQEGWLSTLQFLGWMARRHGIEDGVDEHSDDEEVEMMEDHEELARALQEHGSGYGDIHLVDLAGVLESKNRVGDATYMDPKRRKIRKRFQKVRKTPKLAQKLGQLQPFSAVFPQECMGQLASFGPT